MKLFLACICIFLIFWIGIVLGAKKEAYFTVIKVIDGDSIIIDNGTEIRMAGIDAPELSRGGQPFALEAKDFLRDRLLNRKVQIKIWGLDKYNRTLATVYQDGSDVNLEMIQRGYAEVFMVLSIRYKAAETKARIAGLGIWSLENYTSPYEWRKR